MQANHGEIDCHHSPQLTRGLPQFNPGKMPLCSRQWPLRSYAENVMLSTYPSLRTPPWPRQEAALNWLALGLLLAAWNASDNDAGSIARPRPEVLRHYDYVSVRAMQRMVS